MWEWKGIDNNAIRSAFLLRGWEIRSDTSPCGAMKLCRKYHLLKSWNRFTRGATIVRRHRTRFFDLLTSSLDVRHQKRQIKSRGSIEAVSFDIATATPPNRLYADGMFKSIRQPTHKRQIAICRWRFLFWGANTELMRDSVAQSEYWITKRNYSCLSLDAVRATSCNCTFAKLIDWWLYCFFVEPLTSACACSFIVNRSLCWAFTIVRLIN